jgi:hypothetical protein
MSLSAGYGRGQWGASLELGLSAGHTISRRSESAAKAAKASATQVAASFRPTPKERLSYKRSSRFDVDQQAARKRNMFRRR